MTGKAEVIPGQKSSCRKFRQIDTGKRPSSHAFSHPSDPGIGGRVSEALAVSLPELRLERPRQVRCFGKGPQGTSLRLWPETAAALRQIANNVATRFSHAVP